MGSDEPGTSGSANHFSGERRLKPCRGYHQGEEAYEAWIHALSDDAGFDMQVNRDHVLRRFSVNESMLLNLSDARRAAAGYLASCITLLPEEHQPGLAELAGNYRHISQEISGFQEKIQGRTLTEKLRMDEISLLKEVLSIERANGRLAETLLNVLGR